MAANKVVFGNKVLIDLTGDTVTEEALLKGYTAHKADGTIITGTASQDILMSSCSWIILRTQVETQSKTVPVKQFRDKPSIAKPAIRFFWILWAM